MGKLYETLHGGAVNADFFVQVKRVPFTDYMKYVENFYFTHTFKSGGI